MSKARISITIEGNTLNVGIPAELAEALLTHGREVLDAIEFALAENFIKDERAERRRKSQQATEERIARHRKIGVQLYRQFRRAKDEAKRDRYGTIKRLGEAYGLNHTYASYLISRRRQAVCAYVKMRHLKSVNTLREAGLKNRQIAERIGISESTVDKYLREVRRAGS